MKTKLLILISLAFALHARAGSATWNLNPTSGDWNVPGNWMPATVPNGNEDVATFDASNVTGVSLSQAVMVDSVVFASAAPSFTITAPGLTFVSHITLTVAGAGVINSSGKVQNFIAGASLSGFGQLDFTGSATAGASVTYETEGGQDTQNGALMRFLDTSDAGSATFNIDGAPSFYASVLYFLDSSSARTGTFNVYSDKSIYGGHVYFFGSTTADHALFNLIAPTLQRSFGLIDFVENASAGYATFNIQTGRVTFQGDSSADHATFAYQPISQGAILFSTHSTASHAQFTLYGSNSKEAGFGGVTFEGSSHAANAVFTLNGASASRRTASEVFFTQNSFADNANLTVNGGTNGGAGSMVNFSDGSHGDEAAIQLSGNAILDISAHKSPGVSIGSLAGDGAVSLGANNLTVGTNNRNAVFSGVIDDGGQGGSLTKTGNGQWQLSAPNTYSGGTFVSGGILAVVNQTGSGTGPGAVEVNAGALAGGGIIAGAVTIGPGSGSGASLAPSELSQPTSLTINQTLNFQNDGAYNCKLATKSAIADEVAADGVTIASGAQFNLQTLAKKRLRVGTVFTVISNTASTPISGTFANLADGATISANGNDLQANYEGGDGNDLTLTVVQ